MPSAFGRPLVSRRAPVLHGEIVVRNHALYFLQLECSDRGSMVCPVAALKRVSRPEREIAIELAKSRTLLSAARQTG
jgi:hypothetical protein